MHPYRNLLSVEHEILSSKLKSALRGIAFVELFFGCTIVGLELTANLMNQEADIFTSVLGIWAGFMTLVTGFTAYTNSRISTWIHPIHSTFLVLGHTFAAAFGAVSTLGAFGLRCVNLRSVPVGEEILFTGTPTDGIVEHVPAHGVIHFMNVTLILEYTLIVLYIINFMVLGVSFGMSGAVMRAVRLAKVGGLSVPETDDTEVQLQRAALPAAPVVFAGENKKTKTQIVCDMEATANGFYRRLEEDPDGAEHVAA